MQTFKKSRLTLGLMLALGLSACGADSPSNSSSGTGNAGTGTSASTPLALASVQTQLSGVLTGLGTTIQSATPNGSPLDVGGFVKALAPTLNDLINGPSATLTGLLNGVQTVVAQPNPAGVTTAAGQIQTGITALAPAVSSLAQNLPCALGTLVGQRAAICTGTNPAAQLQKFVALFNSGGNPFAGTPLAPLGTLGALGTPVGGPTGTPIDALLKPLIATLGVPSGAAPKPVNGALVDQLGQGLAAVGNQLVQSYNSSAATSKIPLAGQVVATIGYTLSDLGTTLSTLPTGTGQSLGTTLGQSLTSLSNLLTAPTGLLGTLASASGQPTLVSSVASGNTQLNGGISLLKTTLDTTLLKPADNTVLQPLVAALAPLTCALTLFGDCNGVTTTGGLTTVGGSSATAGLTNLTTTLTGLLGNSMTSGTPTPAVLSTLTSALGGASASNGTLVSTLTTTISTLPVVSSLGGTGNTGLLGGLLGNLIGVGG